jgi:hypothetical protein
MKTTNEKIKQSCFRPNAWKIQFNVHICTWSKCVVSSEYLNFCERQGKSSILGASTQQCIVQENEKNEQATNSITYDNFFWRVINYCTNYIHQTVKSQRTPKTMPTWHGTASVKVLFEHPNAKLGCHIPAGNQLLQHHLIKVSSFASAMGKQTNNKSSFVCRKDRNALVH